MLAAWSYSAIHPYLGDWHSLFPQQPHLVAGVLVLISILCGTLVGMEREARQKPAGLRTVALICVGSTIFTLASVLAVLGHDVSDRGRIAAQVVTGIGFLGAGAIIRDKGRVIGLTTGATIWTVSAIGLIIGLGYPVYGVVLTLLVLTMLSSAQRLDRLVRGRCVFRTCRVVYKPRGGKTRLQLVALLDIARISRDHYRIVPLDKLEALDVTYCEAHRAHRSFLRRVPRIRGIVEIQCPDLFSSQSEEAFGRTRP